MSRWPLQTLKQRFVRHVDKQADCWIWMSTRIKDGYGLFKIAGQNQLAHRLAYEWEYGSIPEGLELDHTCRTPACVRTDHLEAVTHLENIRRGRNHMREKTHCLQGHSYSEENTYLDKKRPHRTCRTCSCARKRLAYALRKVEALA